MFAIRRKDNPLKILAFAYSDGPGKIKESFDPAIYEEVELEALPQGYEMEPTPKSLNKQLEEAFLQILPSHIGQPYLTDTVIAIIMTAKEGVIDANNIDPTGALAAATIRGITLPSEMEADRQQLLELFP